MATNISTDTVTTSNVVVSPQTNKPGGPTEGQIISGTGTGDIAKGVYRYTGGSWESLDNAQGDLNTLRLIMSTDTNANDFNAAKSSTGVAGNTNAVPHETSTGTGMLGALEIPSTGGDALLTEFDANRVLRYYSAGANNNNDYFGITVDVPAWCRGQNIVVEFQYRTEEASAATSNGDFQFSVWDKSNGVKTTSTNTSAVSAGSAITVADSTGMAVGDKIWLESGAQSTIGNVAATFTEAYITEVTSGTAIKISENYTPATTAGSVVVSGWLSSKVEGLLPEADSDTNKVGKTYSLQVKTEEDTDQIVLWISNKSATTNVIELFFDGILISANKFLQASSQLPAEGYTAYWQSGLWSGTSEDGTADKRFDFSKLDSAPGSPPLADSKFISVTDTGTGSTDVTRITAIKRVKVNINGSAVPSGSNMGSIELGANSSYGNSTDLAISTQGPSAGQYTNNAVSIILEKDDYIYFKWADIGGSNGAISMTLEGMASDVILLESQDEIFTDWQSYTDVFDNASWASGGTNTIRTAVWRRVGSEMELKVDFVLNSTGTVTSDYAIIKLPSGYTIDTSKTGGGQKTVVGSYIAPYSTNAFNNAGSGGIVATRDGYDSFLYLSYQANGADLIELNSVNAIASTSTMMCVNAKVPIQGWNSNFNPLLSMPLVEIGANVEQYVVNNWSGSVGYLAYTTTTPGLNTISTLGTVSGGTSTAAWKFTASQRVKVNLTARWASSSGSVYYGITAGSGTAIADSTKAIGNSDFQGNGMLKSIDFAGSVSEPFATSSSFIMEPGDIVNIRAGSTNAPETTVYFGGVTMTVEKDFSNTNMAHIIKPAVAYISDVKAENTSGGTCTTGSWTDRTLNTIKGESWFIESLSSNVFTLSAGTYKINVRAPFYRPGDTRIRLYDNTNSSGDIGGSHYGSSTEGGTSYAYYEGIKTITASTAFKIQYLVANDSGSSCLGNGTDDTGEDEIYTTVQIEKLK